ncbi:alanine racemase [Sulfurospirillum arcachonense]|uniref:alanine racemase n=1 Tax=Sulfurospirillum arcachonense TaxID=57666 RepID=UPI000469C585|nr:alanine racemase [Sulfurospirillum arcachonense]
MAYIQISKANYKHNIDLLCKRVGGKDKLMVVLKDNAYGHGLKVMAELAASFGIKKSAVKNIDEAIQINNLFEETLILADHPPLSKQDDNISFAVHSIEGLKKFPPKSSIHLGTDTGMHRNGIQYEELENAFEIIVKNDLVLKGVFTHHKSADDLNCEVFWQAQNYNKFVQKAKELVEKHNLKMPNFHSCNSAAVLRKQSKFKDDFARCGIATYGYTHVDKSFLTQNDQENFGLKPVMSLWAEKLGSRNLKIGDRVGYGGIYEIKSPQIVSTYDIGYGDGFFRYDGLGDLSIDDGKILGRLSMDSFSLSGDKPKVCLFRDATEIAKYFNTITYEVMTKLSPYIRKEIV